MNSIYENGTYAENNPTWHQEDSIWKAGQILKIMRANNIEPTTLCEVGCGAGGILRGLCDELPDHVEFHGYEISPQAFNLCRDKKNGRLNFHLADLLEEDHEFFDVILCIDVLEHVEDYYDFLRKLRGKGKYKIFHIPLDITLRRVLSSTRMIAPRNAYGHIHYFTKEIALAVLKDTDYKIIDHFYTPFDVEMPNKALRHRLLKLPRRYAFALNSDMAARVLGGYSLLVLAE